MHCIMNRYYLAAYMERLRTKTSLRWYNMEARTETTFYKTENI